MKCKFINCLLLIVFLSGASIIAAAQEQVEEKKISVKAQECMNDIDELLSSTPEELEMSHQLYYDQLGVIYYNLAMEHFRSYYLEEALAAVTESASYFEKSGNVEYQVEAYCFVADINYFLKRYDSAMDVLSSALGLAESSGDEEMRFSVLMESVNKARKIKDVKKENELVLKLQSIDSHALGQNSRLKYITFNMEYAFLISDMDLASLYLEDYRNEIQHLKDDPDQMVIFCDYEARYYIRTGAYREAAACYERQLDFMSNERSRIIAYVNILNNYAHIADEAKFDEYLIMVNEIRNSSSLSDDLWQNISAAVIGAANNMKKPSVALGVVQEFESRGLMSFDILGPKSEALYQSGRYEDAREVWMEYMDGCSRIYGEESLQYAASLRQLGHLEGFCGELESGGAHLIESFRLVQSIFRRELPYVSFDRLESFWNYVSKNINAMAGYSVRAGFAPGQLNVAAYEGLVLSKGLLLASEKTFADYVGISSDQQLKNLYNDVLTLRERMEALKKSYADNKDEIQNLQSELIVKESLLSSYGAGWTEATGNLDVTYEQIRNALKADEVVIDFVDYPLDTGARKYAAFVFRKDWEAPMIVPICNQEDLDAFEVLRIRPDAIYGRQYSSELMKLLWKPLEKYVKKGDVVYMIPSGDLHLISYDSFQLKNGSLLGSRYDFVRLSSARELLSGVGERLSVNEAVLYGGLQYDMTDDDRVAEAGKHVVPESRFSTMRSGNGEKFRELPMSRQEVESVSGFLNSSSVDVRCYVGKEGTEESFMGMSSLSPDIIHLATHGFYYTPEDASSVSGLAGYKSAMRLSGLVLSGGNAEWMGEAVPDNTMGGILTADDIAQCDLSGTDMVVLTACDTGKGKVTSEGVYGLQRAFKKAGVQTMVMSLWQADDRSAADFMNYFYESLTANGWDKRAAMKSARDKMRKKYPSPYYWAGFIMLD